MEVPKFEFFDNLNGEHKIIESFEAYAISNITWI